MAEKPKIGTDYLKRFLHAGRMELAEAFGHMFPGQNAIAKGIEAVPSPWGGMPPRQPEQTKPQPPEYTP
jgi:hypothetical protein